MYHKCVHPPIVLIETNTDNQLYVSISLSGYDITHFSTTLLMEVSLKVLLELPTKNFKCDTFCTRLG